MDKQKVLARLILDLQAFLSVLDSENLSYIAQAQKKSISELLTKLQNPDSPVEDAEYMVMSCPSSSPSNELADIPGTESARSSELVSRQDSSVRLKDETKGLAVPPHLSGGLSGGEEEEDTYEEAEPFVAAETTVSNSERVESDSSYYESYGEEDDDDGDTDDDGGGDGVKDRAHYIRWSASQPCLRPVPESRLCDYLWRRKWLGQWSKQLFIIRNDVLLCYKCAQDLLPQLELNLRGSQLLYKSKSNGKIQHQLKVAPLGSESLVLGFCSFEHADEWRRVMEEVSVGADEETRSLSLLNKSDRRLSCRSGSVQMDSDEEKPSTRCSLNKDKGLLNVLMNCQWQSLWCQVEDGVLNMFGHEDEDKQEAKRSPQYTVQLRGCEVRAGTDTERSYRITLSMLSDQVAVLEVSSSEEKQRWLKLLQDGAVNHGLHDNKKQESTGGALSGLQTRRFPTSNTYMDDPFSLSGTIRDQPVYSNSSILEHMLRSSQDLFSSSKDSVTYSNTAFSSHGRKGVEVQRGVQKLELAGTPVVQLRAGSETNLVYAVKHNKRTSFRQSLAICTERAQVGFLNPLLRRTASAKSSLRRAPSALFIEHGKVFQRKKEWEAKSAA